MTYTVKELAELAGISTRTPRYYDGIGLLPPQKTTEAGYRLYGESQVDRLQQILFYRALGLELKEIKAALDDPQYCRLRALQGHLAGLKEKRDALDRMIATVERTISKEKGKSTMSDIEKFEGFKKKMIQENEKAYGAEVRERYGSHAMEELSLIHISLEWWAHSCTPPRQSPLLPVDEGPPSTGKPVGKGLLHAKRQPPAALCPPLPGPPGWACENPGSRRPPMQLLPTWYSSWYQSPGTLSSVFSRSCI